ncbi:MAG: ATP-binding cassette domain-containing protein [Helicobacteraceae bacterium]|jgi:NitT/TauT family transport system ATP-binding protein|nr:ATP-binding cassette domain-containing protein [Helicobacteraceae bacterium]
MRRGKAALADKTPQNGAPLLEAKNLSLSYAGKYAFRDLSFAVREREIVALLGKSGCGKTSALCVAGALIPPSEGETLFEGETLRAPTPKVSMVFQEPNLLPWLTVERNVSFALELKSLRVAKKERKERVAAALDEAGLAYAAKRFPNELSGGMAQRAALARMLVRQAKLTLLDEPFSALDAVTRQTMQRLLRTLMRRHSASALIVTHDIDEALLIADRVLLMRSSGELSEWNVNAALGEEDERERRSAGFLDLREEIAARLD